MAKHRYFDPAEFAERMAKVKQAAPETKTALGLDLGTNCGIALAQVEAKTPFSLGSRPIIMGQWDLSAGDYESGALRFRKLQHLLIATMPDIIFYEDVIHTPPMSVGRNIQAIVARAMPSAIFFGALRGTLCSWAEERDIPCAALPIGAIKRRATGRGNANKVDMINACNAEFGTQLNPEKYETTGDDNIADAAFCLALGLEQLGS